MADSIRRIKAETAAGRHPQPGRARAKRNWPVAPGGRRPLPAPLRDLQPRCRPDPSAAARRGVRSHRHARHAPRLGYEVGSGVMIGIPGQTYDDLAGDIEMFRRLDLDMIGVGPYLMHPDTPLADPQRPAGRPGRARARRRIDDLQGDRAGAAGVSAGEHSQHHGAGDLNRATAAASWGWCGGPTSSCPT